MVKEDDSLHLLPAYFQIIVNLNKKPFLTPLLHYKDVKEDQQQKGGGGGGE